ncbi:MAG: hypothetical protein ABI947_00045 [Chloroflexota bacterium]
MPEFVLTAYDIRSYLNEALPALRAGIYRGDLSQAKDVLTIYDETIYDEYELSRVLIEDNYSWVFTEEAANPELRDPEGTLVGLAYPLILVYHHPDVFRVRLGGSELNSAVPFIGMDSTGELSVQPGFREGLRAMWEIVGYLTPESTVALYEYCIKAVEKQSHTPGMRRVLKQIADGLQPVIARGYGLVIERD